MPDVTDRFYTWVLDWLRREWAQVKQIPATLVVATLVAGGLGAWGAWTVAGFHYSERLAILGEKVDGGDRRIKDLERQLREARQSVSPTPEPPGSAHKVRREPPLTETSVPTSPTTTAPQPTPSGCQDFAAVTPASIFSDAYQAAPYDRKRVIEKYTGLCVRWVLSYSNLDTIVSETTAIFTDSPGPPFSMVTGRVALDRFPDLKVAHSGDWFQVDGHIKQVGELGIQLDIADIQRAPPPTTTSLPKARGKKK